MISTSIERIDEILPYVSGKLAKALQYIKENAFAMWANGEYEIDGRDIGCNFDENTTTPGFLKLVQTMVERTRSMGLQSQIRRFYLATLDNVIYEVNLGLGETAAPMLIKKVIG